MRRCLVEKRDFEILALIMPGMFLYGWIVIPGEKKMEDEPLLTDLIPKRLGTFWLLFLLGAGFIAVTEFCYFKLPDISRITGIDSIPAFDVTQRDSLASWLIMILWAVAAFYSVLVYIVSRREQDYRRLSDIWIWGAIACLYLSLDQIAGLRTLFRDLMIHHTGTQLYGNGNLWWVAVYLIVFGMIGTRVLTEIRYYLPACNSLLMAGICFIIAGCAELGLLLPGDSVPNAMLASGAAMTGGLFLVLSIGLYGRQLIVTDPATYNMWYSSIWRKLSRRVNPTMYKYKNSEDYEHSGEYESGSHRPRRRPTAAEQRARNEYWEDGDTLSPSDQETIRRRKGRMKKDKKGVFY